MKTFHIKFFDNKKIFFGISIAIMLVGVVLNLIFGTQLDIQFRGGAVIKYSYSGTVDQEDVQRLVESQTNKVVSTTVSKSMADDALSTVSLSFAGTEALSIDEQQAIETALSEKYPDAQFNVVESSSINPTMGQEFFLKCMVSILLAAILLVIYIAFRFKKIGGMSAGVFAILTLLHDCIMVYFTFIVFRIPLNDSFIAVVLTILGYSLNGTIIIYDRIRENRRIMGPKTDIAVLVDTSINQTFTRSIYTALCTFSAVAVVFIVGSIYDLPTVTKFALPMMVGIACGCYSSVCVAGPLYAMWQKHKANVRAAAVPAAKKK